MTQNIIDVGAAPNDGEGDPIRSAFQKVNNNFSQLFTTASNVIASGNTNISIPVASGNANVTVGNVANVAVFTTTGVVVTAISSTGNISGANVISNGVVSANTILTTGNANIGGNVNVTGNMNVSGNITYNDITTLEISDPIIYIGSNNVTNLVDLGMVGSFDDGLYQHTGIVRDHTDGTWKFFSNVVAEPTTVIDWANAVYDPLQTGPLTALNVTANLITSNGNISAVGNVVANNVNATTFYGNATGLTDIPGANVTGTVANAAYAGMAFMANTVTDNAQPNVTSVGTLTSLSASGNIRGGNLVTANYVFTTGGVYTDGYYYANGTPLAVSSAAYGNAQVEAYLPTSNTIIAINSNVANLSNSLSNTNSNVSNVASNVTTLQGQVYANANVQSYLPTYSGNVGGTLTTNSQPYITTVGTLGSLAVANTITANVLDVAGNSTINNLVVTGNVTLPGNITQISGNQGQFFGDVNGFGALYAGISSGYANLPATVLQVSANYTDYAQVNFQNINSGANASADYVATADNGTNTTYFVDMGIASSNFTGNSANALGNVVGANDAYLYTVGNSAGNPGGNLILAAGTGGKVVKIAAGGGDTPNLIATVSNIGLSVTGIVSSTGNVHAGNLNTAGLVSATGNVSGTNINASNVVTATGNVVGANFLTGGVISSTGNATAGNFVTGGAVSANANVSGLNFLAGNEISATGNVTGANFLTGGIVSATGNITAPNLSVGNGTITVNNIVNGGANASGNIGSSSNYFNMVYATATSAQYADLAEVYIGDTVYAPGTVLSFGGTAEVTQSTVDLDPTIAGVVSTNPAYIMNTSAVDPNMVVVALTGRVPCFVTGPVTKGAMMVSNGDGTARAEKNPVFGSVIGKALESFTGTTGTIEIVVGRL